MGNLSEMGSMEVVKLLLEISKPIDTYWGINHAAIRGHVEILRYLLENSVQLGDTVNLLNRVAALGSAETLKILLDDPRFDAPVANTLIAACKKTTVAL